MNDYFRSWWVRIGAAVLIVGAAPLLTIIFLASVGLWPDPNPNPIGPGLLLFVTFWPGVLAIGVGVERVRRARRR